MKIESLNNNENGSALMVTLWITASLSLLLLTVTIQTRSLTRGTIYQKRAVSSQGWAIGGVHAVFAEIAKMDKNDKRLVKPFGKWAVYPSTEETSEIYEPDNIDNSKYENPWDAVKINGNPEYPDATGYWIIAEVSAEDAKLPLNKLEKSQDWIEVPNITNALAEKIVAERTLNKFTSVQDMLFRVKEMTPARYRGDEDNPNMESILTTFTEGRIYVNDAKEEVFDVIPEIEGEEHLIMEKLNKAKSSPEEYFKSENEFARFVTSNKKKQNNIKPWITVTPLYYRIKVTSCNNGLISRHEAIFYLSEDGKKTQCVWSQGG